MSYDDSQGGEAVPGEHHADRGLPGRPAVVGEVLFDIFPDGTRVLGGAPFNVAWHLHAFGLRPLMITRVGDDARGEEILQSMRAWGMDRSGVQVDQIVSTGEVRVDLDGGAPTFAILPDRAYDRLKGDAAVAALHGQGIALVYHGTLIARSEPARTAVLAVRERCRAPTFVDVNLRDPWWSAPEVASLLRGARWVKLNDEELARLTGASSDALTGGLESSVAEFARRHGLAQVVVTLGDQGALVWSEQRPITDRPPHAVEVIDTVGAGDAFSAVWIAGLMGGWTAQTALSRALEFAAELCAVRGAISESRVLYDRHLKRWEDR